MIIRDEPRAILPLTLPLPLPPGEGGVGSSPASMMMLTGGGNGNDHHHQQQQHREREMTVHFEGAIKSVAVSGGKDKVGGSHPPVVPSFHCPLNTYY